MAEPVRLMGSAASNNDLEDLDADGEYEVDDIGYDHITGENTPNENHTDAEGSDLDAEGEEVDDDDEGEPVGAVKMAARGDTDSEDEDGDHQDEDAADSFSDAKTSGSEVSDPDSDESEVEEKWQAESEDGEEPEVGKTDANECVYCGQDEEHDPSPEFEEYLSCAVCGDNAHRQCARDASTLSSNDDTNRWRCTACINHNLEEDKESMTESITRQRLSSVPKLARDLLPSHRGGIEQGGHSMFNDLILPDDPMDGSRSLRKRKTSHEEEEEALPVRQTRKKRRSSELSKSAIGVDASLTAASPQAQDDDAMASGDDSDGAQHTASEHGSSRVRSTRSRRSAPQKKDKRLLAWIEDRQPNSLVVSFHLNNEKVQKIIAQKPKKKVMTVEQERQERRRERDRERRERNRKARELTRAQSQESTHYPAAQPITHAVPFYAFADKEVDENKSKPYGGILSEADADTSKTYPTPADRKRFDDARQKAEEDWKQKQEALYGNERPNKQAGPPSKIKCINFGGWEIDTWHAAPYPEEYSKNKVLYICEFCLKYMNSDYVAWRHKLKCPAKHPPGDEIYRDGKYSFFEVDGRKNPVYCQNLCLLAKLFLGSKTLYYDVEPFLFYVMTENDNYGCHFVGYFSKEKRPSSQNNVSCILVLPIHMRKGYGQYLIEFSYLLTRVEKKTGSPEKPLSDMGLVSYRKYWRLILCEELIKQKGPISISTISERTGMTPDDIVSALEGLRALVRDPVTKNYALRLDYGFFKQYIDKCNIANNPKIKQECLVWTPYVMGRFGQYEDGPALHNVQPREEAEDEDAPVPEEGVQMDTAAAAAKAQGTSNHTSAAGGDDADPMTPALPAEDSTNGDSPAPGTPLANGSTIAAAGSQLTGTAPTIPPTRYEVFPHIPGMSTTAKRRPGRPFGSRRRTSTPQRVRNLPLSAATAPVSRIQLLPNRSGSGKGSPNGALTPGTISGRRTRSKLGESVVNGINGDSEEGGAVKYLNGRRSGTRSQTGSPRNSRSSKGKGKLLRSLDTQDDEDEDEDAEGEVDDEDMDIDAEGEDDEDIVMADS